MTFPLRVLIVEDRPADAELILYELRRAGFAPDWHRVDNVTDYLARLEPPPDIILADYTLPEFDALSALQRLQESGLDVPLIVVTGSISEEVAVECMKQGAADYLLKDRLTRLGPAVMQALERQRFRVEKRRADEQIRASLREKEVLLREIHHRVKNNLQIISSLLHLQSGRLVGPHERQIFKESQNRIQSMALIHQKLYGSNDLGKIGFSEYIHNLANHLFRSYGVNSEAVALEINATDVSLDIDTAVPCGLILNELLSNSLLHAFPEGKGRVAIDFRADDDEKVFALTVRDNGIGLPSGIDYRRAESLGWQLINALASQLEATVEVCRRRGTVVMIVFENRTLKRRGNPHVEPANTCC
jgi:two-component sensor histidine kinase